jgi:Secretion system C-terminal sorting domain
MKKLTLSTLLIAFSSLLIAQPTLTVSNFVPIIGESQLYYVADSNTVVDPTTGNDVVFDYSGIQGYGMTQTNRIVTPVGTTYASQFPTATHVDTTDGAEISKRYAENKVDSLINVGLVLDIPVPIAGATVDAVVGIYDADPEITMKFPFNYLDNFTDNYAGQFTFNVTIFPLPTVAVPTNAAGTVSIIANGWGKLKLPNSPDIDSVLRVVQIENMLTDTIDLSAFGQPDILPIAVNATYVSYFKPSQSKFAILSFIDASAGGQSNKTVISQFPMPFVSVEELENKIGLDIFPNPTNNGYTNLSFNLEKNSEVRIDLMNNLGQNIKEVLNGELQQGKNKVQVKTSNLTKGLYYVNINVNNKLITKKLVIN